MNKLTFENFDAFNRKEFAERLQKAITTFYPFTDGAYVLSLNAKYGSGKTTFLKMWKNSLEPEYKVIYLNAWETDFDEDPIIPLISTILENIKVIKKNKNVRNALQTVIGAAAFIGNATLEHTTGLNANKPLDPENLERLGEDVQKSYKFKLAAYRGLKKSLEEYITTLDHKPLIILIDELDRVRPDYAVKFLEAIKHIFSVKGICFVLGVDRGQLKSSVEQLYGKIDFEGYYRRFITREVTLEPSININKEKYIQQLSQEFFDEKASHGIKFSFDANSKSYLLDYMLYTSKCFELSPRNIEYLFRIFVHFLAAEKEANTMRSWLEATIFLIAVYIKDPTQYSLIGKDLVTPRQIYDYIRGLNVNENEKRELVFLALSFNLKAENPSNTYESVKVICEMDGLKIPPENTDEYTQIVRQLSRVLGNWGVRTTTSTFHSLYKRLEDWRSFIGQ